jgi:hypothetical protein
MASDSRAVTVEVAPLVSAVSVVGTGVELGARPVAIFVANIRVMRGFGIRRGVALDVGAVASWM